MPCIGPVVLGWVRFVWRHLSRGNRRSFAQEGVYGWLLGGAGARSWIVAVVEGVRRRCSAVDLVAVGLQLLGMRRNPPGSIVMHCMTKCAVD